MNAPNENNLPAPINNPKPKFEWDRITALMAVLIGACALAVSLYTARIQNAQVKAQTWPFLQLWQNNADFSFSLSNRGVGPARIDDVKLRVDDKEVQNFDQAFALLSGRKERPNSRQSYFARRVFAANEDGKIIQFENAADFQVFMENRQRLSFEICYCSVLKECYLLNESAKSEQEYIQEVSQCPVGKPGIFR
jgi:hypothetical protein